MRLLMVLAMFIIQIAFAETAWKQEVNQWREKRVESLKKPHGWLSLIGMEWLHKGKNTIGSAKDNDIVLPHGLAYVGYFLVDGNKISFKKNIDAKITANDKPIGETINVKMDSSGEPTVFKFDTFQFYVIERGKPALRIKDSKAKTRTNFKGLMYFPLSEDFRIEAEFIPYKPAKEIEIINVLGLLSKDESPGKLTFTLDGKSLSLDVLDAGDDFYIIFADKTSGRTTYGPGRFLYVPKPINTSKTIIDFNRSYNPPCAFTDYSTCPLPPPQNRIPVYIESGEKKYKRANHDY